MSASNTDDDTKCVSTPYATGVDIPPELFEHIIRHVEDPVYSVSGEEEGHAPSQNSVIRFLASLNLVSRYFASKCRPKLYEVLSIRNDKQLRGLLSLLESGCASLAPLLSFTAFFHIKPRREDVPWIHRIYMVLLPRMKGAGLGPIEHITLTMDGFEPVRFLPRTPPSQFFLYVTGLELEGVHFRHAKDLLNCVFSLRGLECVALVSCTLTCDTVSPRLAFPHVPRSPKWTYITLQNSPTIMPTMISEMLDSYARHRSIAFLSYGHTEALILTEIVMTLYDHQTVPTSEKCCLVAALDDDQWLAINMDVTNDGPASAREYVIGLDLRFRYPTRTYDIIAHTSRPPALDTSRDLLDVWNTLVDCVARLVHINTLKLGFKSPELMEAFVETVRPVLEGTRGTERIELGAYPDRWCDSAEFEPVAAILERFAPTDVSEHTNAKLAEEAEVEGAFNSANANPVVRPKIESTEPSSSSWNPVD